ncbi:hypothetical protein B0A49_05058 [Cryomyces minteri]|uniref:Uncharacterized protein n=1 Tax=Cryomyces minteri TaxID=331657 RepID=A0A4U0XFT7_9PEZI|nr:hypothetical protein B0A49_05058 [Cryomyces minteri]
MPHLWALPTALVFGAGGSALSLYAFVSPGGAARIFGLDIEKSNSASSNDLALQWVRIFGGRNLAIGLAIFAFYLQRMPRAVGTLLLCITAAGTVGTVVTGLWGVTDKAWGHAVGTTVLGLTGWALVM